MEMALNNLLPILKDSVILFFLIGSVSALLIGLLFLLSPAAADRFNRYLNRWVSMRRSMKPMESPHFTERFLYRHHRAFSLFILLGGSYILYQFGFNFDRQTMVAGLSKITPHTVFIDWILSAVLWFTIPATLFAILIGAFFAIRPSSLKRIEQLSNQWVSSRKWMLPLETPHYPLDNWVCRHPRLFGAATAIIASYLSMVFLMLVMK